MVHLIMYLLFK